ncbi:MAG TPA: glycosyltransferase [Candidatus Acidoferrales bacterium]|nr:glycosyltransferase [Candidatus Acidoferrales bacterium]
MKSELSFGAAKLEETALGKSGFRDAAQEDFAARSSRPPRKRLYVPVKAKFTIATSVALLWFALSVYLAQPWFEELARVIGPAPAFLVILFIALIPGFLNAHIMMSVILDSPPPLNLEIDYPPVSLLIAAYNEADNIRETFRAIEAQDYPAEIEIIVVDDGSTDNTVSVLRSLAMPNLKIVEAAHGGKARALNEGLKHVTHDILVTIDADTFLHPQALKRIVARLVTDPANTAAVAGCVLVKNSRESFMTRLQEWDYFTGIASAKRQQSLYQGTLVAQGAFSAFRTEVVRSLEGWPSVIGEDIVFTWALLKDGWRVSFEATAIGFTRAPAGWRGFFRQRRRWARGMIEGLKQYGHAVWRRAGMPGFFVGVDFIIPFIDFFYTVAFLPGILLALTGRYYIVGPITLLVIPMAFLIVLVMYVKQKKVFESVGLKVRRNTAGFLVYMLIYQAIMSPICVVGYLQELGGAVKKW